MQLQERTELERTERTERTELQERTDNRNELPFGVDEQSLPLAATHPEGHEEHARNAAHIDDNSIPEYPGMWKAGLCECWTAWPGIFCFSVCYCFGLARTLHRAGLFPYGQVLLITLVCESLSFGLSMIVSIGQSNAALEIELACGGMSSSPFDASTGGTNSSDVDVFCEEAMARNLPVSLRLASWIANISVLALNVFWVWARIAIVAKYKLNETRCVSCICALACSTCAIGQQMMHVDRAEYGIVEMDCSFDKEHPVARGSVMPLS